MATRMRKMKYEPSFSYKLLYANIKDGYHIAVVSYGTHPCAYVSVPKGHPYYGKAWDEIPIECHGGVTFSEPNCSFIKWNDDCAKEDIWWIGWDYAHFGDFSGIYMLPGHEPFTDTSVWETRLIKDECLDVVKQLKKAAKGA